MRLIDADVLKAVFEEKSSKAVCGEGLCKTIIFRINEAPTVDAIPVIRCKDCKYFTKPYGWNGFCEHGIPAEADDFCSLAERRDK